jgi:NAD(P)-dependent dehydrogenase (short-subunit alcohol dehydrogenase family)
MATKSKKSTAGSKRAQRKTSGVSKQSSRKQRASTRSTGEASELHQLKEPQSPMPAQHQRKPGLESMINTGSITGLEGSKHLLDYSATKGAIHAFGEVLTLLGGETTAG